MGLTHLLDSNVWITLLRRRDDRLAHRVNNAERGSIAIASMVAGELLFGVEYPKIPVAGDRDVVEDLIKRCAVLPFDLEAARVWARVRSQLERAGTRIGGADLIIASIAVTNNLTLVTHNTREYKLVPGLRIEDWQRE